MRLLLILTLVMLLAGGIALTGCTGTDTAPLTPAGFGTPADQGGTAVTAPAPAPAGDPGLGLPPPSTLALDVPARHASFMPEDLIRIGNSYDQLRPAQNVAQQGALAEFSADWTGGLNGAAYCMYSFYVEGYNLDPIFYYSWDTAPDPLGAAWIGLANWSTDSWDWWQCGALGYFTMQSIADYDNPASHELLAVAVVAGTGTSDLTFVRVGPTAIVPSLKASPASGLAPLDVDFDASGSINELGDITSYSFDFDGDMVADQEGLESKPSYAFPEAGTYPVTLTVQNSLGETAQTTLDVHVYDAWSHTWGGADYELLPALAVTADAIYAAGVTKSYTNSEGEAGLLLKYGLDGSFEWARTWSGTVEDSFTGVAASGDDVFTCGRTESFGAGDSDVLVQRWDSSGNLVWSRTWGRTDYDAASGIGVRNSAVYVCGFSDAMFDITGDAVLLAYDFNGNVNWAREFGYPGYRDSASCLTTTTEFISGDVRIHVAGDTLAYSGPNSKLLYSVFDDTGFEKSRQTWDPGQDAYSSALWIGGVQSDERYVVGELKDLLFSYGLLVQIDPAPVALSWSSAGTSTFGNGVIKYGGSLYVAGSISVLGGDSSGLLCQFSGLGALEGCRTWTGTDSYEEFQSMAPFPGSGFILGGQADSPAGSWSAMAITVTPQSYTWDDQDAGAIDPSPINPVTGSPSLAPDVITDATLDEHVAGDQHEAYLGVVAP